MASVDLICLANSYKLNRWCVAGLRVDGGGWIRPVSGREHGELEYGQLRLPDGSAPRTLDVIRVGLSNAQPQPNQPENWRIDETPWELVERPAAGERARLVADWRAWGPTILGDAKPSMTEAQLQAHPAAESLALVQPGDARWYISDFGRARAAFRLWNVHYDLPLTDPAYVGLIKKLAPGDHGPADLGIPADAKILFTISLSEPFDGVCYKLVAAVVVPPASWRRFF